MERDFDVAAASKVEDPVKAGFGHAYGFIIERLFKGKPIPVLPIGPPAPATPPQAGSVRRLHSQGKRD